MNEDREGRKENKKEFLGRLETSRTEILCFRQGMPEYSAIWVRDIPDFGANLRIMEKP